jgi:ABC-2 type transport system ATP-binding protein
MEKILEINNISKSYNGQKVLDNLSLTINKGDIYGLIGINGSGKTTLIRIITGLAFPKEGTIKLYGVDSKDKKINEVKRKISAIVENPSLNMDLSGKENMILQAKLLNVNENKIDDYLKTVRLYSIANSKKKVKDYSLGMRQRLAIAVSLLSNPEFIILDEPANGLDPEGIKEIRDIINELHKNNVTVLVSSHLLDELAKVATKFGILNKGKIIKEISKDELESKENPLQILSLSKVEGIEEVLSSLNINKYKILDESHLVIPMQESILPIINALEQKGIKVLSIEEKKRTIEEYFLKLIGGEK